MEFEVEKISKLEFSFHGIAKDFFVGPVNLFIKYFLALSNVYKVKLQFWKRHEKAVREGKLTPNTTYRMESLHQFKHNTGTRHASYTTRLGCVYDGRYNFPNNNWIKTDEFWPGF